MDGCRLRHWFTSGVSFQLAKSVAQHLLHLLIGQSYIPDSDVVDHTIHKFVRARIADVHRLAFTHQSRFALERNRFLAIVVEI